MTEMTDKEQKQRLKDLYNNIVEVEVFCEHCGSSHLGKIRKVSSNWYRNTPYSCERCDEIIKSTRRIADKACSFVVAIRLYWNSIWRRKKKNRS